MLATSSERFGVDSWVNSLVDPDEVAGHLPAGLRPHVGSTGGTIVGCCMIEIADIRMALGGFASALETDTLLMSNVDVIWRKESDFAEPAA